MTAESGERKPSFKEKLVRMIIGTLLKHPITREALLYTLFPNGQVLEPNFFEEQNVGKIVYLARMLPRHAAVNVLNRRGTNFIELDLPNKDLPLLTPYRTVSIGREGGNLALYLGFTDDVFPGENLLYNSRSRIMSFLPAYVIACAEEVHQVTLGYASKLDIPQYGGSPRDRLEDMTFAFSLPYREAISRDLIFILNKGVLQPHPNRATLLLPARVQIVRTPVVRTLGR